MIDGRFNTEQDGTQRISVSFLNKLIDTHTRKIAPKYRKYQNLYEGKHKILKKKPADANKPCNRLVNDFFGQTIDNTVGYFLGNPVILNYTEPVEKKTSPEPNDVGVDLEEIEATAVQEFLDYLVIDKVSKMSPAQKIRIEIVGGEKK